jgi:predicted nuclease of predicted toxin-antitoxin system
MKLLIDMNLSPRWVKTLAEAEIEASHWSSLGPANASDADIMSFARTHGYAVLTHDLDFSAILAATQDAKPSVVQIRAADVRPETAGPVLIEALRQMAAQLEEGALLTIDPARARMRVLPLGSK